MMIGRYLNAFLVSGVMSISAAWAQETPVGLWQTIDDKTNSPRMEVRIAERDGMLFGKIEKLIAKDFGADRLCTECSDDRKDKPLVGLEVIRGAKRDDGDNRWNGGKIVDPESGKEYRVRLTPLEGGKKLEVRGYIGPLWRNQVWLRQQ